jgi:hypothetical protein
MATVHEILQQSLKICKKLDINEITCVFDQAIYAKATEVKWKHSDTFESLIIRMGTFHTICTMLAIIGKIFQDAGLRDLAVESDVIAEGSISGVLEGQQSCPVSQIDVRDSNETSMEKNSGLVGGTLPFRFTSFGGNYN